MSLFDLCVRQSAGLPIPSDIAAVVYEHRQSQMINELNTTLADRKRHTDALGDCGRWLVLCGLFEYAVLYYSTNQKPPVTLRFNLASRDCRRLLGNKSTEYFGLLMEEDCPTLDNFSEINNLFGPSG